MEKIIKMTLIKAGIRVDLEGFKYLCKAIELGLEHPELLHRICKGLYTEVANFYNTTYYRVERSIRHAIAQTNIEKSFLILNKMFHAELFTIHDKPTPSQFIALMIEYIKLELYKEDF